MYHLLYYLLVTQKHRHSAHGTPSASVLHKHNYNIHNVHVREKLLRTLLNYMRKSLHLFLLTLHRSRYGLFYRRHVMEWTNPVPEK